MPAEGYLTEWGLRIDGPDGPKILTRASKAEAEHWLANGRLNGQAYSALGAEVVSRTTSDWLSDPERGGTPWSEVLAEAGHAAHQDQWGTTLCAEDGQPWPCRTVLIVENSHLKGRLDYVTSWGEAWFRKSQPVRPDATGPTAQGPTMTTDLADATYTPAQITFMMRAPWFDVDNDVHLGACDDVNRDVEGVQVHPSTDGAVTTITVTVAGAWKSPEWSRAMEAIDYLHDRCKQARCEPAESGHGGSAGAGPTGDGSTGHGAGRGGVAAGDRTVHAAQPRHPGGLELVRYGRAGKWYVESAATLTKIERVGIERAAELAVIWVAEGGEVYLGQPGGRAFDTAVVAAGGRTVLAADRGGQR